MQNINISTALVSLGKFLNQFKNEKQNLNQNQIGNSIFFERYQYLIENSHHKNGWFTPSNIIFASQSWANALQEENIKKWLSKYHIPSKNKKTIGLVLAGNIPLVGFHDIICVLISGHKALVKTSSSDNELIKFYVDYLIFCCPALVNEIEFTEKLENFDAVIATGSNNTARYFEYYFRNKPSIIRKNRNSVAVLSGKETVNELEKLGADIFTYFGLGCRNVSKIFVPKNYDFKNLFEALFKYKSLIDNQKYINNYDYNKAVFLMSLYQILDNGFLVLKEDTSYSSPIASLFYEYYDTKEQIEKKLETDKEQIQCIVSHLSLKNNIDFGQTQLPQLWDYADGVDTLSFLIDL